MNRIFLASLCALVGVACTSGGDDPTGEIPGCEGKCDGVGTFAPIAGPESLVHCELNASRDVVCEYTGVPDSFPVDVTLEVNALGSPYRDSSGNIQPAQIASIEFQEPGTFTLLGSLPSDQLPVTVLVSLEMRADFLVGNQPSQRTSLRSLSQTFTFDSAGDETPDLPLPLEFWPVRLFAADGGSVRNIDVGPQTIDVSPWEFFIGDPSVEHSFDLPMLESDPQEFLLPVAPRLTTLRAEGTYCNGGCDDADFVFTGPGIYSLSGEGAQSFEPPVGTDGGTDAGSFDGGPALDGSAWDGSSTDAGVDASVGRCGTNGQRPCDDGTCAENHELDGDFCFPCGVDGEARCSGESDCAEGHLLVSNVCEACGNDGERACRDSGGSRYCNEGHLYRSSDQSCTICGDDGQVACRDSGGSRYCNEGHLYRSSDQSCTICGDDGQVACRDSGGSRYCNEGHLYRSSDQSCTICGDDGQVACRDSGGSRYCNEGHFYRSSDQSCTICGDDGQVACRDSGGRRYCNEGFRVSSNMCVPE